MRRIDLKQSSMQPNMELRFFRYSYRKKLFKLLLDVLQQVDSGLVGAKDHHFQAFVSSQEETVS